MRELAAILRDETSFASGPPTDVDSEPIVAFRFSRAGKHVDLFYTWRDDSLWISRNERLTGEAKVDLSPAHDRMLAAVDRLFPGLSKLR